MIKSIYTAGRSLEHRIKNIDVIANNLANINTTGYKREVPFAEVLSASGDVSIKKLTNQEQGSVIQTSNPLDMAITGKGFFVLQGEDGQYELTRDGRFKISENGYLVNDSGMKVMGQNGAITMEEELLKNSTDIKINKDGEIKIGDKSLGTILVANVPDGGNLSRAGNSNFIPGEEGFQPAQANDYSISQGYLEEANTNPIEEMEAMIQLNKAYESVQKVINSLDTSLQQANEIGKV